MAKKLCLLICENFRREAKAIVESEPFDDVSIVSFPSFCHHRQNNWDTLARIIRKHENMCSSIDMIGGCVFDKLGKPPKALEGCRCHKINFCFEKLAGRSTIDNYVKKGAYLLSPGWLSKWRRYLEDWGFDRITAREFFAESATKLVLFDTGIDKRSAEHIRELADYVNRPYDIEPVGLDYFRLFLTKIILNRRLEEQSKDLREVATNMSRHTADFAMITDLLAKMALLRTEEKVVAAIFELFTMLCAPTRLTYLPIIDGGPGNIISSASSPSTNDAEIKRLAKLKADYVWSESADGFLLRLTHMDKTVGCLEINGLAFPEHRNHYLNLALFIGNVCSLAINNARTFQKISQTEEELQKAHGQMENRVKERTAQLELAHDQLLHAEKLSAIGKLSASIAHEFNNPLFGIRNVLDGIRKRANLEKDDFELLEMALEECDRMKFLIQDLQDFNRPTSGVTAPMDVHKTIDSILLLVKKEFQNKNIQVKKHTAAKMPNILGVADQIKQVLLNLLNNAGDAMPKKGGIITITTEVLDNEVAIHIKDTGVGIKPENMAHIFEPFFTTKPNVKGTGLGLAVSYGIINKHNGKIEVESNPCHGTTFSVILPIEEGWENDIISA